MIFIFGNFDQLSAKKFDILLDNNDMSMFSFRINSCIASNRHFFDENTVFKIFIGAFIFSNTHNDNAN
jgi:hypothetical protein